MNDTKQQTCYQDHPSDQSTDDDVQGKDSDCTGNAEATRDEPQIHPAYSKGTADKQPHKEEVTASVLHIHRLEQESQEQCCQERKKDLFEKGLHIRTLRPIRLSILIPTRYQLSSISIRVGFHWLPTITSKHSPQCRPP